MSTTALDATRASLAAKTSVSCLMKRLMWHVCDTGLPLDRVSMSCTSRRQASWTPSCLRWPSTRTIRRVQSWAQRRPPLPGEPKRCFQTMQGCGRSALSLEHAGMNRKHLRRSLNPHAVKQAIKLGRPDRFLSHGRHGRKLAT